MLRVVLDTNIYISALIFGGLPEQLIFLAKQGAFENFTSPAITKEIRSVLVRQKFAWSKAEAQTAIDEILSFSIEVRPKKRIKDVIVDDADHRILECAEAADADYIISGDNDLLRVKRFGRTFIVSPSDFWSDVLDLPKAA